MGPHVEVSGISPPQHLSWNIDAAILLLFL